MNRLICSIVIIFISSITAFSQQPEIIFTDDFKSYQNGSDGYPIWTVTKGIWQIKDQRLVQQTKEYDCGAMLNIFIDFSFELAVDFKVLEGDPGAGFFFHSEDFRTTDFSHMSRFESTKTMLIGYFMQAGYECTHSARFDEQNFSKWHRLVLKVDQDEKQYSVYLDNQPIAEGEPILFPAGYCGLQSSGSIIEFDNVSLKRLPMKRKPIVLSWLHHFMITKKNELVIPHKAKGIIQKVDFAGETIATFGVPRNEKGQLEYPTSIAQLSNGDFVIGDEGLHRIHIFTKKGEWKNSAGCLGNGKEQFNRPVDVCTTEDDHILVVDQENNRVQVWDKNLNFVTEFGKNELEQPAAVAMNGQYIYLLNNGMNQVEIYLWENNKIKWQRVFLFGSGQGRDILVQDDRIYLSVGNEVRLFDTNGELIKKFTAESINGIYPFGLAIDKNEQIYIADYRTGRIVIADKELREPKPEVELLSNTQVKISFSSPMSQKANLRVKLKDQLIAEQTTEKGIDHQFIVENLTPSSTYHVQFFPALQTIPTTDDYSKRYALITPPEQGKKHFWSLPIVTIIFTNVLDTAKMKPSFPEPPPLAEQELARIKSQIEDGIRFYWMNSGMNLFLDNHYIIIDEKLFHHQIFGSQWWYPPKEEWVVRAIEGAGKKVADYVSVLYLACVRDYNEKSCQYELRGKGGGFTAGIGANSQYGLSYWEVTHANHGSGNNWLMTHEFHHQLDELFLVSGYPEYWFNHFSSTVNTAADFGEHFDGNAWILKNWPKANWYDLKFGNLRFTIDEDMDGVPDNDLELPMDEIRLNSSPRSKDSDGDGVSDLEETFISNWIIEGCGETYGGTAQFPDLINPDTDGDNLTDGIDPYPLYPFKPEIPFRQFINADSVHQARSKPIFARLLDNRIHATVYAHWDSAYLSFVFKIDRLAPIKLMIDADADGWFIGKDNYLIYLRPKNANTMETELVMVNCSDPKRWPFHDKDMAKKITVNSQIKEFDSEYFITVKLAKDEYTGLTLMMGETIGINIGFLVIMDAEEHEKYLTIFEPNRFFDVELVH